MQLGLFFDSIFSIRLLNTLNKTKPFLLLVDLKTIYKTQPGLSPPIANPNPAQPTQVMQKWILRTDATNILILSADTDIYHIGFPLHHGGGKDIVIQISPFTSKELKVPAPVSICDSTTE